LSMLSTQVDFLVKYTAEKFVKNVYAMPIRTVAI
jgi:hypothetical protein